MRDRYPITPERYEQFTKIALALLIFIVFTGAAVRLTGSGLGCPTWPKCTETSVHSSLTTHGVIEFGNRVLTFLVSAGVIAAALGAYLVVPQRRDLRYLGWSLPFGVLVQAIIGGLSVRFQLAPGWVMSHYIVSSILLIWAFDLWWRSKQPVGAAHVVRSDRSTVYLIRGLMVLAGVAIVLGTISTAAGPHAGASGTGEFVGRFDFWGLDTLSRIIHIHGYVVTALGLGTLYAWWRVRKTDNAELTRTLVLVLALLASQGVLGIAQYQLELPAEMVWLHVALATLTWVGFVHLRAAAGPLRPRDEAHPAPATAG
ncbi:Heme A synthase [Paraconexibacter sp. AEG42_29]|uniref:Heme A synthase n=1 Tax=Paraconexibacter sp. AEG42_29 TaxID=2997339 RepID=A0AAU7B233_9ACTN